jgi:hypothetical protein
MAALSSSGAEGTHTRIVFEIHACSRMIRPVVAASAVDLVLNWFGELARRVAQ